MKRLSVPLLVGLALLATPLDSAAQDYTPIFRTSTFVPLVSDAPGVVSYSSLTGLIHSVDQVLMPFPFIFYGDVFNQINISRYGYVTFSSRPGLDDKTGGYSDAKISTNQFPLPQSTGPNGLIAAWWDSLSCPAGTVKTQDAVIQGSRTFTVEWNGCYISTAANSVQMQIRFTEGSPVIRVYYGGIGAAGTHSATVGIENPPRWRTNPITGAWELVTGGGTEGVAPTFSPVCSGTGCTRESWPADQMIQYGRFQKPDLMAGANGSGAGLEIIDLSGAGTVTFELRNTIENSGLEAASGLTWGYYLSADDHLDLAVDRPLGCSHDRPETIPGASVVSFLDTCTVTLDPGFHRICTFLDPITVSAPEGAIVESNEENNAYCTEVFAVGADLAGWLSVPTTSVEAGGKLEVQVRIENRGFDPASDFAVQIWFRDCAETNSGWDVLVWETRLSFDGHGAEDLLAEVPIQRDLTGWSYCAVLVIDPEGDVPEQDEDNNGYSSCVDNGEQPAQCAVIVRSDLQIREVTAELPRGCYFGEAVEIAAEVCNDAGTDARGFGVAFYVDLNMNVSIVDDTFIAAIPQACADSDECIDLGRGAPTCIGGVCHAPCTMDSDCGAGGLRCEPSSASPGKSCQLVIEAQTCRWVGTTADLPTVDIRTKTKFDDGNIYFGAIADWRDEVFEKSEFNNTETTESNFCWTRNPDFEAVEVRTHPAIAAGETVPVYRRVYNRGVEGGTFGYRYVLSSNEIISAIDLALELVGAIGEDTVGPVSQVTATDLVRLPAGIVPGEYYLGILLDPENRVRELVKDNNTARTSRLVVVGTSLQVVTSSVPSTTVNTIYAVQLAATGGQGDILWSQTAGSLPSGMALEDDGLLHGTPSEVGVYVFEITVTSNGNTASRCLALEVLEAYGPLTITSVEVPPAFQNVEYQVMLGASGGRHPYTWSCPDLPTWLSLDGNLLHGTSSDTAEPGSFSCAVTDANESTVSREFRLGVYSARTIRIRSQEIIGDVDRELSSCLAAEGGSGRYDWWFDPSSAPEGVGFAERENAGCFSGVPKSCGTYLVGVTATDEESGLFDIRRLLLTIYCNDLRLTTLNLPIAERGALYEARLETSSTVPVVFELTGGALPRGLALSSDGRITGIVAASAATGAHEAAVRFHDNGGGSGAGAISIAVAPDAGPELTITNTETRTGCSASGHGPAAGLVPVAAFALLGLRFRRSVLRRTVTVGVAAAALLLPVTAVAAATPWYATYQYPKPYGSLDEGEVVVLAAPDTAAKIVLDGWTVPFFGENYGTLWFHENGLILFSEAGKSERPYPIPYLNKSNPTRNFITAWWGDHQVTIWGTSLRYLVRGTAPNREIVFEWIWQTKVADENDGGEHQVSIFEDGTIAFRWGEIVDSKTMTGSHRTVMGMMDVSANRYLAFQPCSAWDGTGGATAPPARCSSADWNGYLRGTEAVFTTLPNLQVRAASIDGSGLVGLDHTVSAIVHNDGPYPTPARVRFHVSRDAHLSEDDIPIGTSAQVEVGAYADQVVSLDAVLPWGLDADRYFLIAVADPDDTVKEYVENDNVGPAHAFHVGELQPDLTVLRVTAPPSGEPGSTVTVGMTVRNLGNLVGADFPYAVMLSKNSVITLSDRVLAEGTLTVGAFRTLELQLPVTIPFGTTPGAYHLGVVLDPYRTLPEFDAINNSGKAEQPLVVSGSGLVVHTVAPRSVQVGTVFCIPLVAEGGDGVYVWSHASGTLPPGLELIPGGEAGDAALCGRPTAVGLYDFTVQVVSGNLTASTEMAIEVTVGDLGFRISSGAFLTARFQQAYEAGLVAFGGAPPYTWTLVGGELPVGLSMEDDGLIFGTPLEAGTFLLTVSVSDAAGRTDSGDVTLQVVPPPRITCATRTLGTIPLGEPFTGKLLAAGGSGSYEWTTRSLRRVVGTGFEMIDEAAPPGLELGNAGEITGNPEQVGSYIWTLEVGSAIEADFDLCQVTVTVAGGQGLTVITTVLPSAVPDEEYVVRLQAINGIGDLTWTLAAGASLPGGISLDSTGLLSGTPTSDSLRGETSRTFGFQVEVQDDRNLKGTGLLSLSLTQAPEAGGVARVVNRIEDDGCQAAGGGFGLAALGLVLVALGVRPRAAWKGGIAALLAVLFTAGCSDDSREAWTSVAVDLCVELGKVCDDPAGRETCDPADGLCKCGGHRGVICEPGTVCHIDLDRSPPVPSCVSGRCDGVVCNIYEACDASDGHCKCQGKPCGEGQTCLADGCSGEDPCAGVVCPLNQVCDPSDRICKCGGNSCSVGETCRRDGQGQGYCVGRRCVGKNCPAGTECNPADGLCHCGTADGDVCTSGQACVEERGESVCEGRDICEGVVCQGNTVCSPLDGKCHCGGYTAIAPVCSSDQTCDQTQDPPRCTNGAVCEGVVCAPGTNLSCDGEIGDCRCGGTGGVTCAPGEGCVDSGGEPTCVTPCDPLAANVGLVVCGQEGSQRKGCYLSPADGLAYCADAGARDENELCIAPTDCEAGHHCVAAEDVGVCRRFCDIMTPGDCGRSDRACVLLDGRPSGMPHLGVCAVVSP